MGESRGVYRLLVGKPEGKRPLGRPSSRWIDIIKMLTGEWRKLHTEEFNVLYCSPNIVRVIKSRRMRWAGHVVRMGEKRHIHGFEGET
jgi:hypothetical protein